MSTYKVDSDKAFSILAAVAPPLIYLNGAAFTDIKEFSDKFREHDFNILNLEYTIKRLATKHKPKSTIAKSICYITEHLEHPAGALEMVEFPKEVETDFISELHKYLERTRGEPCVIVGRIGNCDILSRIFDEQYSNFSYVYLYPNDANAYKKLVHREVAAAEIAELCEGDFRHLAGQYAAWQADKKTPVRKEEYINALNEYVTDKLDDRKKIYEAHLEEFGRMLVVLV